MKRLVNILAIVMSCATGVIIICTFLTSYQFVYLGDMFNTYFTLQLSLAITMAAWGIKFWLEEFGKKRYIYTLVCFLISIASIYFIFSLVR